jgi:predicted outer membrane repeat protein
MIITHSNVYIRECLFKGNSAQVGGAIYSEQNSNVTICSSTFTQNSAEHSDIPTPGGVMIVNSRCTVDINDSIFWNNTHGGVIVLLSATAIVRRTEFVENSCLDSGGVFSLYESILVVENIGFYKNTAQLFGGAIHAINYSSVNVSESIFDQNEAAYGGVINVKTQCKVRLSNSVITSNRGTQVGGVMLMRTESTLIIENCTLGSNSATYGGVLYEIYSNITVQHSIFYNNTSSDRGGVMSGNQAGGSNITLSDSAFFGNRAGTNGGVVVASNSRLTIDNTIFSLNSAAAGGGILYGHKGSIITIERSVVTQNSAYTGNFYIDQSIIKINASIFESNNATFSGGFLYINRSNLEAYNSNFADNMAIQESGGVFYVHNASVSLHNCTCSHNRAATYAGVIDAVENSIISVNDSIFTDNTAGYDGGALTIFWNSIINMDNSVFMNNTATYTGGAVTIDQTRAANMIKNSVFINNSADLGGAIFSHESDATIMQSFFLNNTATQYAGAFLIISDSHVIINDSIFLDNVARVFGGALRVQNFSSLTTYNNTYGGNLASIEHSQGGVIQLEERSLFIANNSEFISNRAGSGGAISMQNSTSFLSHCMFRLNQVRDDGGALHVITASHIDIKSSTFVSNSAPSLASIRESPECSVPQDSCFSTGGVVQIALVSSIIMDNCTFTNNSAEYGGIIASFIDSNITIHQCIFFKNTGLVDGAVIFSDGFLIGNITESVFLHNRASENGGAISLYYKIEMNIDGCMFGGNYASVAGGAIYCHRPEKLTISNSTFIGNVAGDVSPSGAANHNQNISDSVLNECSHTSAHYGGGAIFVNFVILNISNCAFVNNGANYGSVARAICSSTVNLRNTTCSNNWAVDTGGVLNVNKGSKIVIEGSTLNNNLAKKGGGVIFADQEVSITINDSSLVNNSAEIGGTVQGEGSNITISHSTFHSNSAKIGVLNLFKSSCMITCSYFVRNSATKNGGTTIIDRGTLSVYNSVFVDNTATLGGVIYAINATVSVSNSSYSGNRAIINGGGIYLLFQNNLTTRHTTFNRNVAGNDGGAIFSLLQNTVNIIHGQFSSNQAQNDGAVFFISYQTQLTLSTSDTEKMNERDDGSGYWDTECELALIIENNKAERGSVLFSNDFSTIYLRGVAPIEIERNSGTLGTLYLCESTLFSNASVIFEDNVESIHAEKSTISFSGNTSFSNCTSSLEIDHHSEDRNGAAVKSIQSDIIFDGYTTFAGNKAESGAAIHAIESNVNLTNGTVIVENRAKLNGGGVCLIRSKAYLKGRSTFTGNFARFGGAVYLEQSTLDIFDESVVRNNTAQNGGGLYSLTGTLNLNGDITVVSNTAEENGGGLLAIKSTIIGQSITQFADNKAPQGGACSLDGNTKFYHRLSNQSEPLYIFTANRADMGGAIFISDETKLELCTKSLYGENTSTECFFYTSGQLNNVISAQNFIFSDNTAGLSGDNLFGGLLDRCNVDISILSHNLTRENSLSEGLASFQEISKKVDLDSIGSHPVRVCICKDGIPNCSYHSPPIEIKSGQAFLLELAALDQVNHMVNATIHSSVDSLVGGLGDGQAIQKIYAACTELTYSIYSPHESEQLDVYADGPCNNEGISQLTFEVKIVPCSCPIGFQILSDDTNNCVCGCDSDLADYITECEHSTESVIRRGNFWLTYINASSAVSGYLVYPNCPLDYCHLPTTSIRVNLNHPLGSDAQCTSNKAGLLCGACQEGLSLSLGSSRCIPCPSYWPVLMILILVVAFLAGIGIVIVLLVFNMTVAVGTINALVFYANIVEAYKSTFFPSSTVSFASVIISWLNLELGFDICLFEGMDKYTKTWLQLAFPTYMFFLVGATIFTSQRSTRFAHLVGKRNPVATLATLILLSYAKLLQTVITALSFATLEYPDGSRKTVWLPDATVRYFDGKHSALFLVAITILFVGIFFTTLLLFWQWILRLPDVRCLRLLRHHKFQLFIETYHAPYNLEYRYWTGLLLSVRVVLYFVAAVNVSGDPRVTYFTLLFILGGLMTGKWVLKRNLNKMWQNDFLEGITHANLMIFTAFSWYTFETGRNQSIAAHISVAITLILLIAVTVYHIRTKTNIIKSVWNLKSYKHSWKMHHIGKDDKVASEVSERHERFRRTSTFSVVEVPSFDGPSTIPEESEGLANIEFHELDVELSGTCFVNPQYIQAVTETTETIVEEEEVMLNRQADLILDELTR